MRFSSLVLAATFCGLSIAGYVLEDDYMTDFYGNFDFFSDKDPTNGFVKYVDESTARQSNLINNSTTSSVQWGVDSSNKTPNGRPSVRIHSKKTYTHGLVVLDVAHMPFGCGTWPAFWMLGPDWPSSGEIDILEGVNDQTQNGMTLHTGPNCKIGSDTSLFAGDVTTPNCDVEAHGQDKNVGCSIKDPSTSSYGAGLNAINGGVFATEWTSDAISVYFFPRDSIPDDVLGDAPDPSSWGMPSAKFTGGCDIANTFKDHQIVFDTTFCGDWAGVMWEKGSCTKKAATCEEWVRDNPEAFADAYWEVNALKVYKTSGEDEPAVPSVSSRVSTPVPVPTKTTASVSTGKSSAYPVVPVPTKSKTAGPIPTSSSAVGVSTSKTTSSGRPVSPSQTVAIPTSETARTTTSRTPSSPSPPVLASSALPSIPVSSLAPTTTLSHSAAPSTKPAAAPTGRMSGFQWPQANQQQQPLATNTPQPASPTRGPSTSISASPSTQTSSLLATPSLPQNNIQAPIPTSTSTSPIPPNVEIKTIYETVYVTAPVATVTATATAIDLPDGAETEKKRAKRHVEEQKRKRGFGRGHARL